MMLNGFTGFLITSDGYVYFTNNGFNTITEETIEAGYLARNIVLSADEKTVFLIALKEGTSLFNVYRY